MATDTTKPKTKNKRRGEIHANAIYTRAAIERILGVKPWSLIAAKRAGHLKQHRIGHQAVYHGQDLIDWVIGGAKTE